MQVTANVAVVSTFALNTPCVLKLSAFVLPTEQFAVMIICDVKFPVAVKAIVGEARKIEKEQVRTK